MKNLDAAAEKVAVMALAIRDMLTEEDGPIRASVMTELVAHWLAEFEAERQPHMLAYLTGTAVTMMGHKVTIRVEEIDKSNPADLPNLPRPGQCAAPFIAHDETVKASVDLVVDKARALKLHGVVLLSPVCQDCGGLHDFTMVSDMEWGKDDAGNSELARLLRDFAEVADNRGGEPHEVRKPTGGMQ